MTPDGYYAVPDPRDPDQQMTYWRLHSDRHGQVLDMWPAKARYGPMLYRRDKPKDRAAQIQWMRDGQARRGAWLDRIRAEIAQDPAAAGARFAELSTRCLVCARALTDAKSKLLGIGPECRRQAAVDEAMFAEHVTPRIAAAHAVHLSQSRGAAS